MGRPILANLGFLLQIAGSLTIVPIAVGLYFNETQHLASLFITCITFLACGFLLNVLCERKELDFKSASILVLATFIILPLIGAIPYMYDDPFKSPNLTDRFTNSYFESVSGFTTTGFSFVQNSDTLAKSMLLYRSLTELMGGVGIVFLLCAFFHTRKSLNNLGNALGIETIGTNVKRVFLAVFAIYGIYILAFMAIFYFLGFQDLVRTGSFVIDTITGGFQPSISQFQQYLNVLPKICITILMLLGSVNFAFNYHMFTLRIRKAFSKEVGLYLLIITIGTSLVFFLTKIEPLDSLFHVVSMTSSTGYEYVNIASLNDTVKSIFILLMLIGGCAFSMAGGIRVSRLIAFATSIKQAIRGVLIKEKVIKEKNRKSETNNIDSLSALVSILLFVSTLVVFSIMFSTIGVSFTDALFEIGSALTTNGISMGATTVSMPLFYKWLLTTAMIIGRVEIMSILIAISRYRAEET